MQHDHFFRRLSRDETEMQDVFCFAAPLPVLGRLAEIACLRRYMQALLRERIRFSKRSPNLRSGNGICHENRDTRRVAARWVKSWRATSTPKVTR